MKLIKPKILFVALIIAFFLCGNLFAQQNLEFLSYKLPREDRKSLMKAINTLTEKMRSERWSEVYELISDKLKENWDSKEEFIQWQKEDKGYFVAEFKAKENTILVWNNEKLAESVHLIGCLSAVENGRKIKYSGTLEAMRSGTKNWLFNSLPYINPNNFSGGRIPC